MSTVRTPIVTTTERGVRTEVVYGDITIDRIYVNEYQKPGTRTAQLRQIVETKSFYPSQTVSSSMQNNVFATDEFDFKEQEFKSTNTRMAWVLVPEKATDAEIAKRIAEANAKGAVIYKVLSNEPILDENQQFAITQKLRTLDQFAKTQVVRYSDNEENKANGNAGKIWLDQKGRVQYRRTFFWNSAQKDIDQRGNGKEYVSAEIKAELEGASVMHGQALM